MTSRLLLGLQGGQYVLNITKIGYDVLTSDPITQPHRFSFSSRWEVIDRILEVGFISSMFRADALPAITDPGYIPACLTHVRLASQTLWYDNYWDYWDEGGTKDQASWDLNHIGYDGAGVMRMHYHYWRSWGGGPPDAYNWPLGTQGRYMTFRTPAIP